MNTVKYSFQIQMLSTKLQRCMHIQMQPVFITVTESVTNHSLNHIVKKTLIHSWTKQVNVCSHWIIHSTDLVKNTDLFIKIMGYERFIFWFWECPTIGWHACKVKKHFNCFKICIYFFLLCYFSKPLLCSLSSKMFMSPFLQSQRMYQSQLI